MGPSPSELSLSQRTKTILGFGASFKKMGCLRLKKERGERVGRVRIGGRVQWVGALTVIVVVVGCCDFLLVEIEKTWLGCATALWSVYTRKKRGKPGFCWLVFLPWTLLLSSVAVVFCLVLVPRHHKRYGRLSHSQPRLQTHTVIRQYSIVCMHSSIVGFLSHFPLSRATNILLFFIFSPPEREQKNKTQVW